MQKEKVQLLPFTKSIRSLQRLIFTSSFCLAVFVGFTQTDTTFSRTKTYENSIAPDTVIIERIKVQKERVYIVKHDTVVQTDTILKITKETVFQNDTVVVFTPMKAIISIGLGIGTSFDYDRTHYWNTHSQYYHLQKEKISEKKNLNVELLARLHYNKWTISLASGVTELSEQLEGIVDKNKLIYLHSTLVPYYSLIKKPWGNLQLGVGTGLKSLLRQKGTYIDPNNITETGTNSYLYPTNKNLWVLTCRLQAQIILGDRLSFSPQLRYENHPTSITTTDHSILFWKDIIGVNGSLSWSF